MNRGCRNPLAYRDKIAVADAEIYRLIEVALPKLSKSEAANLAGLIDRANKNRPKTVDEALDFANNVLKGHGIEPLRGHAWKKGYYGDIEALYVNMGDTYDKTLIYDVEDDSFIIGPWGDLVEKYPERFV